MPLIVTESECPVQGPGMEKWLHAHPNALRLGLGLAEGCLATTLVGIRACLLGLSMALGKQGGIGTSLFLALGPSALDSGETVQSARNIVHEEHTEHACAEDAWG
jgi:hypothetical protein